MANPVGAMQKPTVHIDVSNPHADPMYSKTLQCHLVKYGVTRKVVMAVAGLGEEPSCDMQGLITLQQT